MNQEPMRWFAGEAALHARIERAFSIARANPEPIQQSTHRTVHRLVLAPPRSPNPSDRSDASDASDTSHAVEEIIVKIHHSGRGLRGLRSRLKRAIHYSPARREWNALNTAAAKRVPVPAPLAWGRLPNGDEAVVTRFVHGDALRNRMGSLDLHAWTALCETLAAAVDSLHAGGLCHGDLHPNNLQVADSSVTLLDFQRAHRLRGDTDRLADWARLESSLLRAGMSEPFAHAFRRAAKLGAEFDQAMVRFERDHQRGRSRKRLRVGHDWAHATTSPSQHGLRESSIDEDTLRRVILPDPRQAELPTRRGGRVRIHEAIVEGRAFVCKRVSPGSPRRAIADLFRGTSGRRAFVRGQTDRLLSDRSAPARAYLDRRRFGIPLESWLILDRVGTEDLDQFRPTSVTEALRVTRELATWLAASHARGLAHRDLKAGNIRISAGPNHIRFWLVDLEDLSRPAHISEAARIESLCQLNASLTHENFDRRARMAFLEAYAARLPFAGRFETVATEIARGSLARRHRWQAEDCDCV